MAPNNPIEHVGIIVKENHTFDNYFGRFPGANGATLPTVGATAKPNPLHDHAAWLNRAAGAPQLQYTEADIPTYFAYARQLVPD
jgi:hypothetical protein